MALLATGGLAMLVSEVAAPIRYSLPVGDTYVALNEQLGKPLTLKYLERIHCIYCGRKTSKSFNQGYCFPCMKKLARCDTCIVSPEKCHYEAGTCREPDWGEQHCLQPHYVYLANSSGIKVGITRAPNIPKRWIDQGALQALPIAKVATRYQSGVLETLFKQQVADKTNWRAMLKGDVPEVDLAVARDALFERCREDLQTVQETFGLQAIQLLTDATQQRFEYPVLFHPEKVVSHNLDKKPEMSGTLLGIKGQYLILDSGVINIRKYAGYQVELHC